MMSMATTSFLAFLRKEMAEIRGTWRLWVLPGILLFVAVSSPIIAELTPALVRSVADQPGVVIELPDPVALDGFRQFVQSLNQIVLLALIITTAGVVSGEARSGTAVLVLTKPVSRSAFILAKIVSQALLLSVATVIAAVVCWLLTLAVFGEAPVGPFVGAVALWLVYALLIITLMTLLSVAINATAGAAGAGIGIYFVLLILGQWGPTRDYSPAGVGHAVNAVLEGRDAAIVLPLLLSALAVVAITAAAAWLFRRQELSTRLASA
jgi:ABC-2 type transport system permease protein